MKKVFNYLAVAASAILVLSACTSDKLEAYSGQPDTNPESPDNAITFGTYVGKSGVTRAGYEGSITDTELKDGSKAVGFGVFAFYTGKNTYNDKNGTSATLIPNFMYNEKVYWDNSGTWKYDNIKYWPNEVQTGDVDDQDSDSGNNPASTPYNNGGNLSFFAYAPYVALSSSSELTGDGITKINESTKLSETNKGNAKTGDPTIEYVIAKNGNVVDLLWGTYSGTTENVLGLGNTGVTSTAATVQQNPLSSRTTYSDDILKDYTTNADLTKQKTNGQVGFAFKHALSKIGGAKKNKSGDAINNNSGLMVVLDIDNNGAESGGTKNSKTVVTIEDITISNSVVSYTNDNGSSWTENKWIKGGTFNLATGKWTLTEGTEADKVTHKITNASSVTGSNAVLATSIAEPTDNVTMEETSGAYSVKGTVDGTENTTVEGVTTTKKNVYKTEANPFVFIPGTKPSFNITVTYYVRTFDSNLANTAPQMGKSGETGTWTNVKQVISKNVTFTEPVQLNKMYNLVMHLGLTSVKFTATVSDWDVDGWNDSDNDGEVDEGEVALRETYLPINVGDAVSTLAFPTENKTETITIPGGTTKLNLTLTGLTDGQSYTVNHSETVTGDDFSNAATFTASGTSKDIALTLAHNKGTTNVTRTITVVQGSVTQTIKIVQTPLPLVATLASPFNAELANTAQSSTALLSSLKDAAGNDVLTGATLALDNASDTWVTISSQNVGIAAQESGAPARSAKIIITKNNAKTNVVISQAAGS